MNKYYRFRTEKEMKNIIEILESKGYRLPFKDNKPTFESIKLFYNRNKVFVVNAYYNTLNKKYEYIIGTKQIFENNHGRKIKIDKIQ